MTRLQRVLAAVAGVALVAAAAHVTIVAGGGYTQPGAIIPGAIALGVLAGGALVPAAAMSGRLVLAIVMTLALIAGEAAALLATAERVIVAREQAQAPLREATERHKRAARALAEALAEAPKTASRGQLDEAQARLAAAEAEVRKSAAAIGCRQNCAKLLQDAVDAAAADVEKARSAVAAHEARERERIASQIANAKAALAAAPIPPSAAPLADRLKVEPWVIDVLSALLVSIGVNGLALTFIAFASHGGRRVDRSPATQPQSTAAQDPAPVPLPAAAPRLTLVDTCEDGPADLVLSEIERARGVRMEMAEVYAAYVSACKARNLHPLSPAELAIPLKRLCTEAGIQWQRGQRGTVHLVGVKRKASPIMISAPRAARASS